MKSVARLAIRIFLTTGYFAVFHLISSVVTSKNKKTFGSMYLVELGPGATVLRFDVKVAVL